MALIVESRRKKVASLQKIYPAARLIDVTSKGDEPWVKFSPFYPHGNVPIPFSSDVVGQSVEGIWQGLKVFESTGVDTRKFDVTTMKGLKRTVRKYGTVNGHAKGVDSDELLSYLDARLQIYLPCYRWVLDHCLQDEVVQLRKLAENQTVLLLDYETNTDIMDLSKPLSHAGLVKRYCDDDWYMS